MARGELNVEKQRQPESVSLILKRSGQCRETVAARRLTDFMFMTIRAAE